MHKYIQNQSYVGSSGQTLTTDVSMAPCNWQICHQNHVLCTTFLRQLSLRQGRGIDKGGGGWVGATAHHRIGAAGLKPGAGAKAGVTGRDVLGDGQSGLGT